MKACTWHIEWFPWHQEPQRPQWPQQPQWPQWPQWPQKSHIIKKTYWAWCCYYPGNKMTYPGLPMWNGSSKILYFIDFGHSFCWRLWRPWMLLSTKSKGHKSNFRISWMYRSCFYDLKVHFWWPNKCSKHQVLRSNTLYIQMVNRPHFGTWILLFWLRVKKISISEKVKLYRLTVYRTGAMSQTLLERTQN